MPRPPLARLWHSRRDPDLTGMLVTSLFSGRPPRRSRFLPPAVDRLVLRSGSVRRGAASTRRLSPFNPWSQRPGPPLVAAAAPVALSPAPRRPSLDGGPVPGLRGGREAVSDRSRAPVYRQVLLRRRSVFDGVGTGRVGDLPKLKPRTGAD